MSPSTIFVVGATGAQGGAMARALLRNNWVVHALVRDPSSSASQTLKSQGASLFKGDWDDLPALQAAATGCTGVFLNLFPSFEDAEAEVRHAQNILAASKRAGIAHVIYSSAIGVDRHESFFKADPESFLGNYFRSKRAIEEEVQTGGYETWTILRGVTFMSNFLIPSASFMFPELTAEGRLVSAYTPDTKILLVDPEAIGGFGFAAFSNPQKFGGKDIDIAAEALGVQQMATLMEKVSGKKIEVRFRTEEEVEALKGANPIIASQVKLRNQPPWVSIQEVKAWGVPLRSFEEYLEEEKDRLQRTIGDLA
jgi:uncharacterized protein YbjT (DUF2867 family)